MANQEQPNPTYATTWSVRPLDPNPADEVKFKELDRERRDPREIQSGMLYTQLTSVNYSSGNYTAADMLNAGLISLSGTASGQTPTARQIVTQVQQTGTAILKTPTTGNPSANNGLELFRFYLNNTTGAPITVTPGAGITVIGAPLSLPANSGPIEFLARIDNSTAGSEAVTIYQANGSGTVAPVTTQETEWFVPVQASNIWSEATPMALGRVTAGATAAPFWRMTNSTGGDLTYQISVPYLGVESTATAANGFQLTGFRMIYRPFNSAGSGAVVTMGAANFRQAVFTSGVAPTVTNTAMTTGSAPGTLLAVDSYHVGSYSLATPVWLSGLVRNNLFTTTITVPTGQSVDFYGFEWVGQRSFI